MTKKRSILLCAGMLSGLLLAGISFTSCEKETSNQQSKSQQVLQSKTTRTQQPNGTITMGSVCGASFGCGTAGSVMVAPKYNLMAFAKDAATIINHPTLRYTIYKYNGVISGVITYTKVGEVTCSGNNMCCANSTLVNSTSFYLVLMSPTDPATLTNVPYDPVTGFYYSNALPFTTGNNLGQYCGGGSGS